jgi:hypothetical protein
MRNECPGGDCPCASADEPHGHAEPEVIAAAIRKSILAGAVPVDAP